MSETYEVPIRKRTDKERLAYVAGYLAAMGMALKWHTADAQDWTTRIEGHMAFVETTVDEVKP